MWQAILLSALGPLRSCDGPQRAAQVIFTIRDCIVGNYLFHPHLHIMWGIHHSSMPQKNICPQRILIIWIWQNYCSTKSISIPAASRDVATNPLTERSRGKYWFLANQNIVHKTVGSNSLPSSSYKLIIHYLDSTKRQRAKVNKWLVKIVEYQAKQKTYYFFIRELADKSRAKFSVVYIRPTARKRIPMQCPFCAVDF